jgi:hypothetical protein
MTGEAMGDKRLLRWSWVLFGLVIVHDLDHVRQGRAVGQELYGVGVVALVSALVMLVLAARRHPLAPAAAVTVGFGNLIGLAVVHIVPDWGPFSDPYPAAHVDAGSWSQLAVMMGVGLMLGLAGLAALRRPASVRAG